MAKPSEHAGPDHRNEHISRVHGIEDEEEKEEEEEDHFRLVVLKLNAHASTHFAAQHCFWLHCTGSICINSAIKLPSMPKNLRRKLDGLLHFPGEGHQPKDMWTLQINAFYYHKTKAQNININIITEICLHLMHIQCKFISDGLNGMCFFSLLAVIVILYSTSLTFGGEANTWMPKMST